jgi:hypothetical protein
MDKYVCKWGENVTYKVEIEAESVDQATYLFWAEYYDSSDVKEIDVQFDELDSVQKMDGE